MKNFSIQLINQNPSSIKSNELDTDGLTSYIYCFDKYSPAGIEVRVSLDKTQFIMEGIEVHYFSDVLFKLLIKIYRADSFLIADSREYFVEPPNGTEFYCIYLYNKREPHFPVLLIFLDRDKNSIVLFSRHTSTQRGKGRFIYSGIDNEFGITVSAREFISGCCNYLDSYHNDLVAAFPGIASDEMYIEAREEITKIRNAFK